MLDLSIIVPMYRAEKQIARCLRSITKQRVNNIEIICVDDGSDDCTCEVVERERIYHPEIHLIRIQLSNASHARNVGINNASGKYLMFVDSDDYIVGSIQRVLDCCKRNDADIIVYGGTTTAPFDTSNWIRVALAPHNNRYIKFEPRILSENGARPFTWNKVYKRELFSDTNIRFDEAITVGEDHLFQFNIFPEAKNIVFCRARIYCYRINQADSLTAIDNQDQAKKIKEHLLLVEKIGRIWEKKGFINVPEYAEYYCISMLDFMFEDITSLPTSEDKKNISSQFMEILEVWHVRSYAFGNYRVMLEIFKHIVNGNERDACLLKDSICKKHRISVKDHLKVIVFRAKDIGLVPCTEYYIQKYFFKRGC